MVSCVYSKSICSPFEFTITSVEKRDGYNEITYSKDYCYNGHLLEFPALITPALV